MISDFTWKNPQADSSGLAPIWRGYEGTLSGFVSAWRGYGGLFPGLYQFGEVGKYLSGFAVIGRRDRGGDVIGCNILCLYEE